MLLPHLLSLVLAAPTGAAPLVEEVVAVIKNPPDAPARVLTLSRLTDEARVALVARGALDAAFQPIDDGALRATLGWVLDQMLLADEAARLQIAEVSRDQAALELRRFQARFPDGDGYARFLAFTELGEEEIGAMLARGLRVDRYLETRLGRGGGTAEGRLPEAVRALLAELRERAEIRVLDRRLAPARPGAAGGPG